MTAISASLVKELRELTGLGMMECKRALAEAGGDLKKAEEILRIRSGAKASKVAARIASEGAIGAWIAPDQKTAALVEINCETDFVAKNAEFTAFAGALAERAARDHPVDAAALAALQIDGVTVEARRQALVQKIGENISIRRLERVQTAAAVALYLHGTRIGVLVEYEGAAEVGKDVAMHVAFAKPAYLRREDVPGEIVARERAILRARAAESGKPPAIVEKMVEGGLSKFLGEVTLLGQHFVKDDKLSVEKMLAAKKARVLGYRYLVVGEGLAKRGGD